MLRWEEWEENEKKDLKLRKISEKLVEINRFAGNLAVGNVSQISNRFAASFRSPLKANFFSLLPSQE